jgi:hypothetical protein
MKTSTFVSGLAVVVVAMILGLVGLGVLNSRQSRPEGVAENWLTDVGDTTRKGVEADARKRAEKIGPASLAKGLVSADAEAINRKSAFDDLEVGKAVRMTVKNVPGAEVGFRVHALRPNDKTKEITGVITMLRRGDKWTVVGVAPGADNGLKLPSEGGPPPSSAPWTLWVGGLVGAAIIGFVTTALVRAATP